MIGKSGLVRLKKLLDEKALVYNHPSFIEADPIAIPHRFSRKQDIEIAAFFAAILAWGQRKTILQKCSDLMSRMGDEPYRFVLHHSEKDLKGLLTFKHRTFNATDTLYFISFLKSHYGAHGSLETAFRVMEGEPHVGQALGRFHAYFFGVEDYPQRTKKHIPTPERKSACKRLNMYLRWMVRKDGNGVDFGLWDSISPSQLVCPCDVHVERMSRKLGLLERKQMDWAAAVELTENLKQLDPNDPVKYDFALFGLGLEQKKPIKK